MTQLRTLLLCCLSAISAGARAGDQNRSQADNGSLAAPAVELTVEAFDERERLGRQHLRHPPLARNGELDRRGGSAHRIAPGRTK